jgi:hypothetical protein
MAQPVVVDQPHELPVGAEAAFRGTLLMDVPAVFRRWYGPFPPIRQAVDGGSWGTPGNTRTLKMAGGGSAVEELVKVDAPRGFGYELTSIRGPLSWIASSVDGEFSFVASGAVTKATWRWTIHPRSALTRPALLALGALWHGWARRALAELANQLRQSDRTG